MTGIILKKLTKDEHMQKAGEFGSIVYASDTHEVGVLGTGGGYVWDKWTLGSDKALVASYELDNTTHEQKIIGVNEYYNDNGSMMRINYGVSETEAYLLFEQDYHNEADFPYVGQYNNDMSDGFEPSENRSITTYEYVDRKGGQVVKRNGSNIFVDYDNTSDETILNLDYLATHKDKLPREDPCEKGLQGYLWVDGSILKISGGAEKLCPQFRIIMTGGNPDIGSVLGGNVERRTFGATTVFTSNDDISHITFINKSGVSKIEIVKMKTVTDLTETFWQFSDMVEFICPFSETENVINFSHVWGECSSLTSFPSIDVSKAVGFNYAWAYCTGLTSFPLLDTSNVTDFSSAWAYCTGLTSFPLLDTSNVTDFSSAWAFCSGLTSFPLLDASNVTDFGYAWDGCTSLTSFPLIDTSNGTRFNLTWYGCTSLVCMQGVDTTSQVTTTDMFGNNVLKRPNESERDQIITGFNWVTDVPEGEDCTPTYLVGHIRYYTDSDITFNTGVKSPTNGYINILGDDEVYPISGQESVTKIEVLNYGDRTSWQFLAEKCINMTEFIVSATDVSKVTNIRYAWGFCTSLLSFPLIDCSEVLDAQRAWFRCESLTEFPVIDLPKNLYFQDTWEKCISLTSFPTIDMSSSVNFRTTWQDCSSLTSFSPNDLSNTSYLYACWGGTAMTTCPITDGIVSVKSGTDIYRACL